MLKMYVLYSFLFLLCFFISSFVTSRARKPNVNRPRSPPALPIIGHLHLLGPSIAKSFQALATRHGPLIRLKIVSKSSILVSQAAIAREILKENEVNFLARPEFKCSDYNIYNDYTFALAEYGEYWRFMRKICINQLFSAAQLKNSRDMRKEEMMKLMKTLAKCSDEGRACEMKPEFVKMMNNITCRLFMSSNEEESVIISNLVKSIVQIMAKYSIGEAFGPLGRLVFSHYGRKMNASILQFDALLEKKIAEREMLKSDRNDDMLDFLLQIYRNEDAEMKLSKHHIKCFILELLTAGSETTSDSLLWILAELINHPRVFAKLREEINTVVGSERLVEDSDIPNLPYLKAVAKESSRLHPVASVIFRRCTKDCKISGYDILANQNVYLNLIPIMRDSSIWENPQDFFPERLTETSSQSEEQSFKMIPFGSGRRRCPGGTLALAISHGVIAKLVQCFDFELEEGQVLSMEETGTVDNAMLHPVLCYPKKHLIPYPIS